MNTVELILLIVALLLAALSAVFSWLAYRSVRGADAQTAQVALAQLSHSLNAQQIQVSAQFERTERELRDAIDRSGQANRTDALQQLSSFAQNVSTTQRDIAGLQNQQIDSFALQLGQVSTALNANVQALRESLTQDSRLAREEQTHSALRTATQLTEQLKQLMQSNDAAQERLRQTVREQLHTMQQQNDAKLEQMRQTVDEKLHATLEQRLGESFKLVSERLEAVHRGLGEMQNLAQGVGDLKRVLTNVKDRGTWGEVQLGALLDQMLTATQYQANVKPVPDSSAMVEYAIRLPGRMSAGEDDQPVWLPIDAKFPKEEYERLVAASQAADTQAVETASKQLERSFINAAQEISRKYISPPHTTDFALMFLPTEGLYAEATRRPGLMDQLQRDYRVTITGPNTLAALLNSLQMGFRTLALEKRSSEVWKVLGAVKGEFQEFGTVLGKMKTNLQHAVSNIERAQTRTRQMGRKLKEVEALPTDSARSMLGLSDDIEEPLEKEG